MFRLRQELRAMSGLFGKNPGLLFAALFVLGLAVSSGVGFCRANDVVLKGQLHVSRALRVSRLDGVWRGARANAAFLQTVAYPRPVKKAKAPAKRIAPPAKVSGGGSARVSCRGLSDLRFPEFTLLTPLL